MSDTAPRNQGNAPQMLADSLLRTVAGTSVTLRLTGSNAPAEQSEVGLMATAFSEIKLSPAVLRKLRPSTQKQNAASWELLVSASSVARQVNALNLASAQALFAMALAVDVAGQDYLIDSVASNEAFGQVYLYRLMLRETGQLPL